MRARNDFYKPGVPAPPGEHYGAFVRFARRHAGTSVLDLGCGFGAYSCVLAGEGWKCVGCDINIDYLRTAALKGLPVVGADSALPFLDRSFDTVLIFEVLEHVADVEKLLAEAFRVARKNVLITVPNSENIEVMQENDVTYATCFPRTICIFFNRLPWKVYCGAIRRIFLLKDPIPSCRFGSWAGRCRFME